jgi:hypothetical protein
MVMQVRSANATEIDHLARLWLHETHAPLVPPALATSGDDLTF